MNAKYTVHPSDVKTCSPDCEECNGSGLVECDYCCGNGCECGCQECADRIHCEDCEDCDLCDGTGKVQCDQHVGDRERIAHEATRLWRRDIDRGVLTGTSDVYIDLARRP